MPPTVAKRTAQTWVLTGICALVYFLDGLIHSILGPLAPAIAVALHLSATQLGPIFSANLVGQLVGLLLIPLAAGRVSQRTTVIACVAGFGVTQAATALSTGADSLFAWRLLTGIFLGGCLPSCLALVTAAAPMARRGLTIMALFMGYGLGATAAGIVASVFAEPFGWRPAMVVVGLLSVVAAIVSWVGLPADVEPARDAGHELGRAGLNPALQIFSPTYLLGTVMLWVLFSSMLTISYCLNSWLPVLLVNVGRDRSVAALAISIFSFGGIVSALGVGVLIDRFGAHVTLLVFTAVATILLFAIGQVIASASTTLLLVLLAICGFFVLGAYGGINVLLATYYPDHLRAVGIGWTKSVGRVGTLITPVLIGWGLAAGMSETTLMSSFAAPALLCTGALAVLLSCAKRRQAENVI